MVSESADRLVVRRSIIRSFVLSSEMWRWHVGRHVDRSVSGIGFVTIPLSIYKITTFTGICIWSLFELGSSSCLTMAWGNVSWKATTTTREMKWRCDHYTIHMNNNKTLKYFQVSQWWWRIHKRLLIEFTTTKVNRWWEPLRPVVTVALYLGGTQSLTGVWPI